MALRTSPVSFKSRVPSNEYRVVGTPYPLEVERRDNSTNGLRVQAKNTARR